MNGSNAAAPMLPPMPRPRRSILRRGHSGAWKVAYADFVTAMMCLFIVLWVVNGSETVRKSVTGYFKDPQGYTRKLGAGPAGAGESLRIAKSDVAHLRERLEEALRKAPDFGKLRDHILVSVTGEGVRIDLLETEGGMFFVTGSPKPTPAGERLLSALAAELGRMGNRIVIEGHTDARPFRNAVPAAGYGNWELSTDRANAARRLLHAHGVPAEQVVEVRGFADRQMLHPADPDDARNRRISIVIRV